MMGGGGGGGGNRVEADRWLATAEKLLVAADLHGAKTFAIRACETDPALSEPAEFILAIADTLLAGESRVGSTNLPDWYAVLRLVRFTHNPELVATQYSRLAMLLNPNRNRLPYADQAFRLVSDAWYVLSDPSRKALYDRELQFSQFGQFGQLGFQLFNHPAQPQQQPQQQHQQPAHHQQQPQTLSFQNQQLPLQLHPEPQPQPPPQPQFPAFQPQPHSQPQQQPPPSRPHFDQQLLRSQPLQPPQQQHRQLRQEQTEQIRSGFRVGDGKQPVEEEGLFNLNYATERIQPSHRSFEPDPPSRSFEMAQQTRSPEQTWPPKPGRPPEPIRPSEPIRGSEPVPPSETMRHSEPVRPPEPAKPSEPVRPSEAALPSYLTQVSQPPRVSRPPPVSQPPRVSQPPPVSQSTRPSQTSPVSQPSQRTSVSWTARPSPPPVSRPTTRPSPPPLVSQPTTRPSPVPPVSQPTRPAPPPPVSQPTRPSPPPSVSQPTTRPSPPSLASQPTPSSEQTRQRRVERSASEPRVPSFWTACPYCFVLYEYQNIYEECVLRCQTKSCRRAFEAVKIPSPPPLAEDDGYYCCWGFFPIGFQAKSKIPDGFSPKSVPRKSAPVVYYDDDDLYIEISDPSEEDEDDHDWRRTGRSRKKGKPGRPRGSRGENTRKMPERRSNRIKRPVASPANFEGSGGGSVGQMSMEAVPKRRPGRPKKQTQNPLSNQASVDGRGGGSVGQISMVSGPSTGGGRPVGSSGKKRMRAPEKDVGKLDLNVEFSNEVEVSARSEGTVSGNGEESNIEGTGFFEGLDEFFSSLPILSSVADDKVKAAN